MCLSGTEMLYDISGDYVPQITTLDQSVLSGGIQELTEDHVAASRYTLHVTNDNDLIR